MIAIDDERWALELLARGGLSQRKIAQAVGISRGTVGTLKRVGHERPRPPRNGTMRTGPTEKCPGCGREIQMPCLACQAAGHRRNGTAKFPDTPASAADQAPKLDGEDRQRYEDRRRQKKRAAAEEREAERAERKEQLRRERVEAMYGIGAE